MKKTFSLLLTALLAPFALASPLAVSGVARNGSTDQPLVGASVRLVKPVASGQKIVLATQKTDAQGRFSFSAPSQGADLLMAEVTHDGMDYWKVAFDGGNRLKKAGLTVDPSRVQLQAFDATTQAVPLDFQVHHLAISSSPTGLKCIERIVVENPSKKTLLGVGPNRISVLLDIPQGAKNLRLDPKITDAKLVKTASGWGVVRSMMPDAYAPMGNKVRLPNALIFNYDMDWPSRWPWGKRVDLSRKTVYPTKFFFVARTTEDRELQVSAPRLGADKEAELPVDGATQMRLVNSIGEPMMPVPSLPAGDQISISVSRPVSPLFWGFAAMTLALCLFLPLAMVKPRRKNRESKSAEPSYGGLVSEQSSAQGAAFPALNGFGIDLALTPASRDLIQKIADLDDQNEAGTIAPGEYQSRRAAWKKQLIESLGSPPQH